jgi:hypothetical protein
MVQTPLKRYKKPYHSGQAASGHHREEVSLECLVVQHVEDDVDAGIGHQQDVAEEKKRNFVYIYISSSLSCAIKWGVLRATEFIVTSLE